MADEADDEVLRIVQRARREQQIRDMGGDPNTTFAQDTAKFAKEQAPGIALSALPVVGKFPKLAMMLAGPGSYFASTSEAGNEPKPPQDYVAPGLVKELMSLLPNGKPDESKPLTKDEYVKQNRRFQPKSQSEYIESEVDKIRQSPMYQDAGAKQRTNMENGARTNAQKMYEGAKQATADEEVRLAKSYDDYRAGWERQRLEHLSKPFVERHPETGAALTYGSPIISAMMTRGIFGKINNAGQKIADVGAEAKATDNMRGLADQINKAEAYPSRALLGKAATVAEAAALPVEARMAMDYGDKKGLPPDAPAAQAAAARMSNIPEYAKGMGYDLASGLIGTLSGMGWAKARTPSPGVDLANLRAQARGIDTRSLSPDELSVQLAKRAMDAKEAERILRGAPPAKLDLIGEPLPPTSGGASGSALVKTLAEPQGQLPPPGGASNQELVKSLMDSASNRNFAGPIHPSNYQPRGQPGNKGQFKKGKPEYPEE